VIFRWPWLLLALAVVPLALALYLAWQRRRRKYAVRFASLSLLRDAVPRRGRWRRHVPFALLLAAVACLVVATARPTLETRVDSSRTSIILTLDESRSMCSTDVKPNRLAAAGKAASQLVGKEHGAVRIGLVVFSGAAQIAVPPTTDVGRLQSALRSLTVGEGGTAIGSGILTAIDAIAEVDHSVAPSGVRVPDATAPPRGSFAPDIVVVLTDGANNRGVDPGQAAAQAAARRVRVYTIGFGTDDPGAFSCTREQLGDSPTGFGFGGGFGGGGFGGFGNANRFSVEDQAALEKIAGATGAKAFRAQSAQQLLHVFRSLPAHVESSTERHEVSVAFVAAGALLALLALALSTRWNRFP
jgi:Ca-activated chloride channel family protein